MCGPLGALSGDAGQHQIDDIFDDRYVQRLSCKRQAESPVTWPIAVKNWKFGTYQAWRRGRCCCIAANLLAGRVPLCGRGVNLAERCCALALRSAVALTGCSTVACCFVTISSVTDPAGTARICGDYEVTTTTLGGLAAR
jgi:hypothetical protein